MRWGIELLLLFWLGGCSVPHRVPAAINVVKVAAQKSSQLNSRTEIVNTSIHSPWRAWIEATTRSDPRAHVYRYTYEVYRSGPSSVPELVYTSRDPSTAHPVTSIDELGNILIAHEGQARLYHSGAPPIAIPEGNLGDQRLGLRIALLWPDVLVYQRTNSTDAELGCAHLDRQAPVTLRSVRLSFVSASTNEAHWSTIRQDPQPIRVGRHIHFYNWGNANGLTPSDSAWNATRAWAIDLDTDSIRPSDELPRKTRADLWRHSFASRTTDSRMAPELANIGYYGSASKLGRGFRLAMRRRTTAAINNPIDPATCCMKSAFASLSCSSTWP